VIDLPYTGFDRQVREFNKEHLMNRKCQPINLLGLLRIFAVLPLLLMSTSLPAWKLVGAQRQLIPQSSHPLTVTEIRKVTAFDGDVQDRLGSALAIAGDILVAGAPNASVDGVDGKGAVYLYQRNLGGAEAWELVKKLSTTEDARAYGFSVAASGDVIVVGAPEGFAGGSLNRGVVYVYARNQGGADQWGQVARLVAADGGEADRFGFRVAIDGDTIAASAPFDDSPGVFNHGSVYVYDRNQGGADQWGQVRKLLPDELTDGARFGRALAISGETILVGSPYKTVNGAPFQGTAYLFDRNLGGSDQWGQVKALVSSNGTQDDYFSWSVALDGDLAVVGAIFAVGNGFQGPGQAYLFQRNESGANEWGEIRMLSANDGHSGDQFGWSVAIDGDVIVVGANQNTVSGNTVQGSAYLFERNFNGADAWGHTWKLTGSDGAAGDRFGGAVTIDGQAIAVGAAEADVDGVEDQGAVYIYRGYGSAWAFEAKPLASDGGANHQYGTALSLDGPFALVGSPLSSIGGNVEQGSAYLHTRNTGGANSWGQAHHLIASDGAAGDRFGSAVSVFGEIAVVAAPYAVIEGQPEQGAVTIFYRNQDGADQWGQVLKLVATDGEAGDRFGSAVSLHGNTVIIGAPGVQEGRGAAYIYARNRGGADAWGLVQKIMADDGNAMDQFGAAVSLYGTYAAIGAPTHAAPDTDQGAVYVVHSNQDGLDEWGLVQKVTANDGGAGDQFGSAVALHHEFLLVGAPLALVGGNPAQGAAYLFERNLGGVDAWGQVRKLVADLDGAPADAFGSAVAVNTEYAAVGSYGADLPGSPNRGAVYVFERNKEGVDLWDLGYKITAADGQEDDQFGLAVAMSGTAIAAGAPFANPGGINDRGAAYIYRLVYEYIDLEISKSVSVPVAGPNQPVSYVLSFSNQGDTLASGVILEDPIPTALTNLSWTSSGVEVTELSPGYVWQIADLLPEAGGTITVTGTIRPDASSGTVENIAEISSPQPEINTANNISSVDFIVDADPPALPVHLSPPNGSSHSVNQLTIQWTASTSPDVAGYHVNFDGVITDVGNVTQFSTPVLPSDTYTWQVAAYDLYGNHSAYTQPWTFTILDTTPPSVPVLVSPANGSTLPVSAVTLVWNPSPEVDTAGYKVRLNGEAPLDVGETTSYDLGAVSNGVYTWQVAAYDLSGNESSYSILWTFTVADHTPPAMPGLLSPPDGSTFDSGVVNLVWTASASPDVAGYRINLSGLIIEVGDVTQYTTSALPNGTYTWQVAAFDGAGNSSAYTAPWSFAITDQEAPEPPTLVSPEDGSVITVNNAILLWDPSPSPDVAGYRLDFNGDLIDIRSGTSFATGALENGTYSWRVAAYDGADNLSEFTPEWQFTIDVSADTNLIPVADAGENQNVVTGELVTLDGSGSYDPDGHLPLVFFWNQVEGTTVSFNPTVAEPVFVAPSQEMALSFRLVVIDALGMASTPDTVTVVVARLNRVFLPVIIR
jgi:uncharacterized repeat protein (TIGR01451 family)